MRRLDRKIQAPYYVGFGYDGCRRESTDNRHIGRSRHSGIEQPKLRIAFRYESLMRQFCTTVFVQRKISSRLPIRLSERASGAVIRFSSRMHQLLQRAPD